LAISASIFACSAFLASAAALILAPAAFDASEAISPASLVVDLPYYGTNDVGLFPIIALFYPINASVPSIAEA